MNGGGKELLGGGSAGASPSLGLACRMDQTLQATEYPLPSSGDPNEHIRTKKTIGARWQRRSLPRSMISSFPNKMGPSAPREIQVRVYFRTAGRETFGLGP